jgi:hypothetical protein
MDQRGKTPDRKKKFYRGHRCLCCVCCKDGSMEREGQKGLKVQNGSKEKNGTEKKIPV